MPGTGKTAMLTEVMRTMQDEVDNLKYKVNINTVNCMSIKEPKQIYVRLVEAWHVAVQPDVIQQAHDLMNSKKNVLK
jgi:cell division control protein 6